MYTSIFLRFLLDNIATHATHDKIRIFSIKEPQTQPEQLTNQPGSCET